MALMMRGVLPSAHLIDDFEKSQLLNSLPHTRGLFLIIPVVCFNGKRTIRLRDLIEPFHTIRKRVNVRVLSGQQFCQQLSGAGGHRDS